MRGDRVEVVVDTGQGTQTFDIVASKNGRRLEVTTARGVVEVSEVTRGGTPVRTGRFMASRLIALVEHPAQEQPDSRGEVQTRRRIRPPEGSRPEPPADRSEGWPGDRRPVGSRQRKPSGLEEAVHPAPRCRDLGSRQQPDE